MLKGIYLGPFHLIIGNLLFSPLIELMIIGLMAPELALLSPNLNVFIVLFRPLFE
jgi:hypothetical protein